VVWQGVDPRHADTGSFAPTSAGLSLIEAPFQVSGDALHVEGGLHALLEYLLFPLPLGHGLAGRAIPAGQSRHAAKRNHIDRRTPDGGGPAARAAPAWAGAAAETGTC
jgi:hypothetical protein